MALLLGPGTAASGAAADDLIFQDRFSGRLADGWSWLREDPAHWRTGAHGLELRVQPGNMWGRANNAKNVLVRSMPDPARTPLEITAVLHNEPTGQWEQTNLVWFYDDGHMVKLGQELVSGKLCVVMGREETDKTRTVGIVPLDAPAVQLRLLVTGTRIHGQYRTVHWRDWREVGDCDLPIQGPPHLSLQCYQGPPQVNHWARFEQVTVRRLAAAPLRTEEFRELEQAWKSGQPPPEPIALPAGRPFFRLEHLVAAAEPAGGKSDADQNVFRHRDGTYGWTWDRRAIATERPNFAGLTMDRPAVGGPAFPLKFAGMSTLVAEMDVISRLEVDRGQHNLCLQVLVSDSAVADEGHRHRLSLWFDWQGADATGTDVDDGFRRYGYAPGAPAVIREVAQHIYRIQGFRGAPPRVNLKAFLDDAAVRLPLDPATLHIWQLRFGNEVWNGSKGRTLVGRLDWILDGRRIATVAAPGAAQSPR